MQKFDWFRSRRLAVVEVEHATQPLTAVNASVVHIPLQRKRADPHEWQCMEKSARRCRTQWKKDKDEPAHPGFARLRVHDLKHTFGRRLRVAGVSFEDRQALLGHKSESVTTDYSAAEIEHLIAQAGKVTMGSQRSSPTLTVLRRRAA
jgi:integrase